MRYGRYTWSHRLLRWGIGITFLWIGVDMFRHPEAWIGFLPPYLPTTFDRGLALQFAGILDIALGTLFIINKFPKSTALVAALHLGAILLFFGIDAVTIRDVGLFGAALALLQWPKRAHARRHFRLPFLRRRQAPPVEE